MSALEEKLLEHIRAVGLPEPIRELVFAPPRKYRADFAWPAMRLLVEVDGGSWVGGRHSSGVGFEADAEKLNLATLAGWRLLRFTTNMIRDGRALATLEQALSRPVLPPPLTPAQQELRRRVETYALVERGEAALHRAMCEAQVGDRDIRDLTDAQCGAVLVRFRGAKRRRWPHEGEQK